MQSSQNGMGPSWETRVTQCHLRYNVLVRLPLNSVVEVLEASLLAPVLVSPRGTPLFSFPKAAVTKGDNVGGFKQQKCICSQFWRPET